MNVSSSLSQIVADSKCRQARGAELGSFGRVDLSAWRECGDLCSAPDGLACWGRDLTCWGTQATNERLAYREGLD